MYWGTGGRGLPKDPSQEAPLEVRLAPGAFAGVPEQCPCSLVWFWAGLGLAQGFPQPLSLAPGVQLQPGSPRASPSWHRWHRGCPSLCFSSTKPQRERCWCLNEPNKGRAEPGPGCAPEFQRPDGSVFMARAERPGHSSASPGGQATLGLKFFSACNNSGESLCSCEL